MSWWDHAACRGMGDLFTVPELHQRHRNRTMGRQTRARISQAKAICSTCPVLTECAAYYKANPCSWMVAAGLTPHERNQQRRGVA